MAGETCSCDPRACPADDDTSDLVLGSECATGCFGCFFVASAFCVSSATIFLCSGDKGSLNQLAWLRGLSLEGNAICVRVLSPAREAFSRLHRN